jgi:hypothetical protein
MSNVTDRHRELLDKIFKKDGYYNPFCFFVGTVWGRPLATTPIK